MKILNVGLGIVAGWAIGKFVVVRMVRPAQQLNDTPQIMAANERTGNIAILASTAAGALVAYKMGK